MMRYIISFSYLFLAFPLFSQVELATMGFDRILQGDRYNPAVLDENMGWSFGLPSVWYNAYHTGHGFKDIIDTGQDNPLLKVQALFDGLNGDNKLFTNGTLQTFKVRYDSEHWSMGFEHHMALQASVWYPDALIQLYVDGNQQWIGQEVELGPDVTSAGYNSYEWLFSYRTEKLAVGIRPKYLTGNYFMQTPRTDARLYTDPDFYKVTLSTNYVLQNAGILEFEDANLLNYEVRDFGKWKLFSPNNGWAIDLGMRIKPSENLTIGFSVADWGSMEWSEDVKTYESSRDTEYSGQEILDLVGTEKIDIDGVLDSLRLLFNVTEDGNPIQYDLPTTYSGSVHYRPTDLWYLALMARYQQNLPDPLAVGVQLGLNFLDPWSIGVTVSHRYGEPNLGLHTSYAGTFLSGFLVVGNILNGVNPLVSSRFSLAAGVNIHWSTD